MYVLVSLGCKSRELAAGTTTTQMMNGLKLAKTIDANEGRYIVIRTIYEIAEVDSFFTNLPWKLYFQVKGLLYCFALQRRSVLQTAEDSYQIH